MLPPIERIEPSETREGDVSFLRASEAEGSECSGSDTNDEARRGEEVVLEPLSLDASLDLKTLFTKVLDFLMKEPPRFFLAESSEDTAPARWIEPEAE
jgi:hypothetical protein